MDQPFSWVESVAGFQHLCLAISKGLRLDPEHSSQIRPQSQAGAVQIETLRKIFT